MKVVARILSLLFCILMFSTVFSVPLTTTASAQPVEEWVARFDNPGVLSDDYVEDIAVDLSGNVYVAGHIHDESDKELFTTIAYDSSGNELWVATYGEGEGYLSRARAIAIGPSGVIYVTGTSCRERYLCDYVTFAYTPSGSELWMTRYNGPMDWHDEAYDIVVDNNENVYVTGQVPYDHPGTDGLDFVTVAYDSNGTELWVASYNGVPSGYDAARAMALGPSGNIYVSGPSRGNEGPYPDFATVAYDPEGNELWVARYDGPRNPDIEEVYDITTDSSGNVYVTGYTQWNDNGWRWDILTVAYDSEGNELWVARFGEGTSRAAAGVAVASNPAGGVYTVGYSWSDTTEYDYTTIAYDPVGNEQWVAKYDGPGNDSDHAKDVVVDESGDVYVTGVSRGLEGKGSGASDYATVAYDSSGNELWVARYDSPMNDADGAVALAVDKNGNAYVTGISIGERIDIVTVKYSQKWKYKIQVDIDPDTLNLRSKGRWITAYFELSGGKSVMDIDISTLLLNGTVPAESRPTAIGDYDEDGIPDLMVKFNRSEVQEYIEGLNLSGGGGNFGYEVTLTITGLFNDGTAFECSDTIRVLPAERMGVEPSPFTSSTYEGMMAEDILTKQPLSDVRRTSVPQLRPRLPPFPVPRVR